ncbi:MAG: glycosyltransferase family 1 protein [Hymenobacter sp.]|nr:MAG: glycosyltransferase family 1 protein [Hymenobacter sp.]
MNIILFAHPTFLGHQSMPRFAQMLADGMRARGHEVAMWAPQAKLVKLPVPQGLKKWLGYLDQYVLFPQEVRKRLRHCPPDTLFVFTDQALGPWVPLLTKQARVVHCHDFLAQRSVLGEIPENPGSWTGYQYQAYIRRGYTQGKHFISVSERTKADLHRFLPVAPVSSAVVYNGLNQSFAPQAVSLMRETLGQHTGLNLAGGYLLHVGGNHFYKNRGGVIELYTAWRDQSNLALPLLLIGDAPNPALAASYSSSPYQQDIHFLKGMPDELVRVAYAGATVFLFPSLAEGFGWPIAEAMASGCPVITTNETPMTEVAGTAGFLIPRRPHNSVQAQAWAREAAGTVEQVVRLAPQARQAVVSAGLLNAKRFNTSDALNQIEKIYASVLAANGQA